MCLFLEGLIAEVKRLSAEIDKLKTIEKDIAEKQSQVKSYGEKEELVKFLRNRIFNQVSKHLSERFREEISQRANQIYRIIAEVDEELSWGDDYNIPESGNGRPDILDEAIWGIDHLLRMQLPDGAVLSIVGEAHASPPSSATDPFEAT